MCTPGGYSTFSLLLLVVLLVASPFPSLCSPENEAPAIKDDVPHSQMSAGLLHQVLEAVGIASSENDVVSQPILSPVSSMVDDLLRFVERSPSVHHMADQRHAVLPSVQGRNPIHIYSFDNSVLSIYFLPTCLTFTTFSRHRLGFHKYQSFSRFYILFYLFIIYFINSCSSFGCYSWKSSSESRVCVGTR